MTDTSVPERLDSWLEPTAEASRFRGRPDDPRLGEWIQLRWPAPKSRRERVALVGMPDDTGVTLNRGRAGAAGGPAAIRRHLFRLAMPMDFAWEKHLELYDVGDVRAGASLLETHARAERVVAALVAEGVTVVALGGGHDFAAPNLRGFRAGARSTVAALSVDPHLDVRPWENGLPHSGTPFRTVLDDGTLGPGALTVFGARAFRNARAHFAYARAKKVRVVTLESLLENETGLVARFATELRRLKKIAPRLAVTIDMDSCHEAEGTSAAPVLGFTARELTGAAALAGREQAVRLFELAEAAPALDPTERVARLGAELVGAFLRGRAERNLKK
jgi:formimidoylglutamase